MSTPAGALLRDIFLQTDTLGQVPFQMSLRCPLSGSEMLQFSVCLAVRRMS